jgi:PBP4 family serine-type D-alanyl-D-alanine carboxypeptidase
MLSETERFSAWRKAIYALLSLLLCGCASRAVETYPLIPEPVRRLQDEIETILGDPALGAATVSVKVVSLVSGEAVYEKNASKLHHPASTMKLLTAAAALARLGPNFRFHTTLYADAVEPGRVKGNLYIKGRGDPLFAIGDLRKLAAELSAMRVICVTGDIVVDETFFDAVRWGSGWMWDDGPIGGYYPHFSALTINRNGALAKIQPGEAVGDLVNVSLEPPTRYVEIINEATTVSSSDPARLDLKRDMNGNRLNVSGTMRIDGAPSYRTVDVVEPALYCGALLKEALATEGVEVRGEIRYGAAPVSATEIADHQSPPLSRIVFEMNKSSDNLVAELLLKAIGAEVKGAPGTSEKGLQAVGELLEGMGHKAAYYSLADGSGVSRYNLTTATLLVDTLAYTYRNFQAMPEYLASLPIAGVDGTLESRMKDTAAMGHLRAKTGTMRGVTTLAGYVTTADAELLAFAILISDYVGSSRPMRAAQDAIGARLAQFSRRKVSEKRRNK